jgi:hypothetical protein
MPATTDPFAAEADEPQTTFAEAGLPEPDNSTKVIQRPAEKTDDSKIVLTFKEGTGFDSSWIVVHAGSVSEADALLDQSFADLMAKTKKVASHFRGGGAPSGGGRPASSAPAGATEPPPGSPASPGEGWVYRSGVTKSGRNAGKVWHGWMPPQGSPDHIKPLFFDAP